MVTDASFPQSSSISQGSSHSLPWPRPWEWVFFSPGSAAEATEVQRAKGVPSHSKVESPESQSHPLPTPARTPSSLASCVGCSREGLNLPQHPEISTKSQTTRQLVVTWYLMVPGGTKKKKVRRSLLLVGGLLFEALQHLPTLIAPGRREERELTQMEGGRGWGTWERREGLCH